MRERVWIDGRIVPAARARVSVFDRGLLYGDAAFETIRVYAGRPFRWRDHLRRLFATLARLSIAKPEADLREALAELLDACALEDAAVRLTVTRGVGEGLVPPPGLRPTVILMARPIPSELAQRRADGVAAIRLPYGRGRFGFTTGHKTTDYAAAVRGRMLAEEAGAFEAIYVEHDGSVSEATTSNVFAVRRGKVVTPPMDAGCLPGITRETVLGLARRAGFAVREAPLEAATLDASDELFLTGSVIEILPVVRLDGRTVGAGRPGELTRSLQERYRRLVRTRS